MKRVDRLFGKKGSSPMKYFVTTSAVEQEIIVNNFGYTAENAPMVGFTRWDALEDKTDPDDRFILVMPTWRAWLEDASEENFKESDYYRNYSEFMKSEALEKVLEENNLRVIMYLHPKFASHVNNFKAIVSDRIELIPFGQHPLNELMMRCSLLITDYSSVCWDVLYMDKPVIYYHFDLDKYLAAHGSYIDLTKDLPSPRVTNQEDLLKEIERCIEDDFIIRDEYKAQLGRFFAHRDHYNCERTYQFLKGRDIG
jgi:CDP-glycerol glycerophosphotransferase (TagB/SpsB family)